MNSDEFAQQFLPPVNEPFDTGKDCCVHVASDIDIVLEIVASDIDNFVAAFPAREF